MPEAAHVPLVAGARVVARTRQCDPGVSAYCAVQLVVYDRDYRTSNDFLLSERAELHAHGWTGANGDVGTESAADSPGHKLHLTYAAGGRRALRPRTALDHAPLADLVGAVELDLGHAPALSLMLEDGNGST